MQMNLTFFSPVEHILTGQLGIYCCISVIYKNTHSAFRPVTLQVPAGGVIYLT
jgi:hypothetical protein